MANIACQYIRGAATVELLVIYAISPRSRSCPHARGWCAPVSADARVKGKTRPGWDCTTSNLMQTLRPPAPPLQKEESKRLLGFRCDMRRHARDMLRRQQPEHRGLDQTAQIMRAAAAFETAGG